MGAAGTPVAETATGPPGAVQEGRENSFPRRSPGRMSSRRPQRLAAGGGGRRGVGPFQACSWYRRHSQPFTWTTSTWPPRPMACRSAPSATQRCCQRPAWPPARGPRPQAGVPATTAHPCSALPRSLRAVICPSSSCGCSGRAGSWGWAPRQDTAGRRSRTLFLTPLPTH